MPDAAFARCAGLRPYWANRDINNRFNKRRFTRRAGEAANGARCLRRVSRYECAVAICRFLSNFIIFLRFPHFLTKCTPFPHPPTDPPDLPPVGHGRVSLSNVQDLFGPGVPAKCVQKATFELPGPSTGVYAKCPLVDICPFVDICHILTIL